jgi:hypothetical protein
MRLTFDLIKAWSDPRPRVDEWLAVEPPTRARLVELEREVRELRAANAILKTAPVEFPSAFFAVELDSPSSR